MIKRLLIIACSAFLLIGCSSDARITSPHNDNLFTIEGSTVTQADLFNSMNYNDSGSVILAHAQQVVLDILVPKDDAFLKDAQTKLDEAKKNYGDLWSTLLNYYGYKTDEEYLENVIIPSLQFDTAIKNVMTDDFDAMIDGLYVRKAAVLQVSKENAAAAVKALEDGTSWADVAKKYVLTDSSYTGSENIYHKDTSSSSIDSTALSYIISAKENGISDPIDIPSNSSAQFIINIVEVDPTAIKDEIIASFAADTTFQTKYLSKLLRENNFKVFDKTIHDAIQAQYPDALAN